MKMLPQVAWQHFFMSCLAGSEGEKLPQAVRMVQERVEFCAEGPLQEVRFCLPRA